MPDLPASSESVASTLLGPEFWAGVQAGADVRISVDQIKSAIAISLSSTTSAMLGAGMIGYNGALAYAAGTAGFEILNLPTRSLYDWLTAAQIADAQAATLLIDCSVAVQTAITAAQTGKFYLHVPPGVYLMNSGVTATDLRGMFGTRQQSIFHFNAIAGSTAFTVNTSLSGAGIPQTCLIDGISLDGSGAGTNKTGFSLGTNALTGRVYLRGVESVAFTGASGQGLLIGKCVEVFVTESLFSFSQSNVVITSATTGFPTTVSLFKNNIRQAVGVGVTWTGILNLWLSQNIIESNGQEGLKGPIAVSPQYSVGCYSTNNHYENNWAGGANQYHINVTGDTAALNRRFVSLGDFFDHNTLSIGAISLSKTRDFLIDAISFGSVPTLAVNIVTGSTGAIDRWPTTLAPITTALVAIDATSTVDFQQAPWIAFTPTITPSGAMTFTAVTVNVARYRKVGKTLQISLDCLGTVGGTPGTTMSVTLPASLQVQNLFTPGVASIYLGPGSVAFGYTLPGSATLLNIVTPTPYTAGGTRGFGFTVTLELA